jgi:hypothetical protein
LSTTEARRAASEVADRRLATASRSGPKAPGPSGAFADFDSAIPERHYTAEARAAAAAERRSAAVGVCDLAIRKGLPAAECRELLDALGLAGDAR